MPSGLMMLGIGGRAGAAGGGGVASITFLASATSTASTITGDPGIIAGDILAMLDVAEDGGGVPTTVLPTGFNSISNITNSVNRKAILSYKKADGTEASASLTGMNGSTANQKVLLVFRPDIPATTLTLGSPAGQYIATNPTPQTVTAGSGTPPLIVLGAYVSVGGVVNPIIFTVGGSDAKDDYAEEGSNMHLVLAYKIDNASPADAVIDMDDEGTNYLMSGYVSAA